MCLCLHMQCFCLMRREGGAMIDGLWQLPFLCKNTSASCLSRLFCLSASMSDCHCIDIPPQPPSNNLRRPVFAGASADLLCRRLCWRFSGSMRVHGWDGGKEDSQDKLGSCGSAEKIRYPLWLRELKTCRIISNKNVGFYWDCVTR